MNTRRVIFTLLLLPLSSAFAQANSCNEAFASFFKKTPEPTTLHANVGKFPIHNETRFLNEELLLPSGKVLNEMVRDPKMEMSYIITPDDRIFLLRGSHLLDGDYKWSAELRGSKGEPLTFPIKAAGSIKYETVADGKNSLVTYLNYGSELSEDEIAQFSKQIDESIAKDPKLAKQMHFKRPVTTTELVRCSEAVQKNNVRRFVSARLMTSLTFFTAGILIQNPERFDVLFTQLGFQERDPDRNYDGDMLFADYLATAGNTIFQGVAGYHISSKGLQYFQSKGLNKLGASLIARGGVSLTSVGLQTLLYANMTDNEAKKVGMYNVGYSTISIVKSHYFDNFLLNKLPELASNACLHNPALKIVLGQRTIRFGEGLASSFIYLKGREILTGE